MTDLHLSRTSIRGETLLKSWRNLGIWERLSRSGTSLSWYVFLGQGDQLYLMFPFQVLALEELHRHRILHRDIKPGNILFTVDGKLIISDFGFSRPFGLTAKQQPWRLRDEWVLGPGAETYTGVVVSSSYDVTHRECGTLGYMAPEVIRTGEFYSYSADIYSAGVVLYEMLNGVVSPYPRHCCYHFC